MLRIKGLIFHASLILSILLSLPIISVASQEYKVGCKVGDWAIYEYKIIGARETENFKVTITAINGTDIRYQVTGVLSGNYSTDVKSTRWLDPFERWGYYPMIIASSLDEGDRIYDAEDAPVIENVSERFVAGMIREVIYLHIYESPYGGSSYYCIDLYYDRATGFMVNVTFSARGLRYKAGMISTNMWQREKEIFTDTVKMVALAVPLCVAIAAIYFLKRKHA